MSTENFAISVQTPAGPLKLELGADDRILKLKQEIESQSSFLFICPEWLYL
jgi:hypothetical protein